MNPLQNHRNDQIIEKDNKYLEKYKADISKEKSEHPTNDGSPAENELDNKISKDDIDNKVSNNMDKSVNKISQYERNSGLASKTNDNFASGMLNSISPIENDKYDQMIEKDNKYGRMSSREKSENPTSDERTGPEIEANNKISKDNIDNKVVNNMDESVEKDNKYLEKYKGEISREKSDHATNDGSPAENQLNNKISKDNIDNKVIIINAIENDRNVKIIKKDNKNGRESSRAKSEHPSDKSSAESEPAKKISKDDSDYEVVNNTYGSVENSYQNEINRVPAPTASDNSISVVFKFTKSFVFPVIGAILTLFLAVCLIGGKVVNNTKSLTEKISELEAQYPNQIKDFWLTVKVNIKEIPILEQPRTILLIYNKDSENTLNKILKDISEVAACEITNCYKSAVIVTPDDFNRPEIIRDYGEAISLYRHNLADSGVMIVRNLERIAGTSAQALHTFCDDYNPVVKKALILITLRTDEDIPATRSNIRYVEERLLAVWSDISYDDKFYPLFTRISGTILKIEA